MGLRKFIIIGYLRIAAAIGVAACFASSGELRGQNLNLNGRGNPTATARPASPPAASRPSSGSTGGGRPLGYGVPGFASGGAAATRARSATAAQAALGAAGLSVYYPDFAGGQQPAGGAGLFNVVGAAPATVIAPLSTPDKAADQILTPSASAAQVFLGAGGFIRPGELAVAFDIDRAPPDQAGTDIAVRLNKLPSLHFLTAVRVHMAGGTAVLRGTVASEHDRDLAARVVMLEASVDQVVNLLVVRNPAAPPAPVPTPPVPVGATRGAKT